MLTVSLLPCKDDRIPDDLDQTDPCKLCCHGFRDMPPEMAPFSSRQRQMVQLREVLAPLQWTLTVRPFPCSHKPQQISDLAVPPDILYGLYKHVPKSFTCAMWRELRAPEVCTKRRQISYSDHPLITRGMLLAIHLTLKVRPLPCRLTI